MYVIYDLPNPLFGIFPRETCTCAQEHLLQHFCDSEKLETIKCINRVTREEDCGRETLGILMGKQ